MNDLIAKTELEKKLMHMINPIILDQELELIRVRVSKGEIPTVQIMADKPDKLITVEECANLSKEISTSLDVKNPVDDNFTLEVSSPGIDRPLTRLKDFERWEGYKSTIVTNQNISERSRFDGVLAGVKDEEVLIEIDEGLIGINVNWIKSARLKF